jgi:hypothetical protein
MLSALQMPAIAVVLTLPKSHEQKARLIFQGFGE